MTRRRVLVTGSRNWTDRDAIARALMAQYREYGPLTVVHGKAKRGADAIADQWCTHVRGLGYDVVAEPHPADWERPCTQYCRHRPRTRDGRPYCPVAGNLRNQEMVDLGAAVCLAFPLPDSRGTIDCMNRADKACIPVDNYGKVET